MRVVLCCCCLCSMDVNRVSEVVTSLADPSANIIFGAVVDER
jgi:cell division GTPase FtsZ